MEEQEKFEYGVEIILPTPDDFLKIKESLTRIGLKSKKTNTLYQSCSILHKRGRYVIIHFKELFALDGKTSDITEDDIRRRNAIVKLLNKWGLCQIVDPSSVELAAPETPIDVIPFKSKKDWTLVCKYSVGKKK